MAPTARSIPALSRVSHAALHRVPQCPASQGLSRIEERTQCARVTDEVLTSQRLFTIEPNLFTYPQRRFSVEFVEQVPRQNRNMLAE
jgi:hypothetical protein